jgi:CHASE2 domain-containing sensor protein
MNGTRNMTTETPPTEPPDGPISQATAPAVSGFRMGRGSAPQAITEHIPTGWQLSAVMSWSLVLGALAVLTMRFGPWAAWLTCGLQMVLIAAVLMRLAWDARVNWIFSLFALLVVALRFGLVLVDRAEYQPELDRFEATPLDPTHVTTAPAD